MAVAVVATWETQTAPHHTIWKPEIAFGEFSSHDMWY